MSAQVPLWLAVSGAAVALTLGSLNIVEKIIVFIGFERPKLSEHYIVASVPVNSLDAPNDFFSSDYLNMPGASFLQNDLLLLAQEAMTSPNPVSDLCRSSDPFFSWDQEAYPNAYTPDNRLNGCSAETVTVAFYGVTNSGKNPISDIEILFDVYDSDNRLVEVSGFVLSSVSDEERQSARQLYGDDNALLTCFTASDHWAGGISEPCIAYPTDEFLSFEIAQTILPGESAFVPIYVGFEVNHFREIDIPQIRVVHTNLLDPISIQHGKQVIVPESRPMARIPLIVVDSWMQEMG
ncbi:MAG: hypothetical protein AAF636_21905 [Pseudomonadota bacterium]